VNTDARTRRDVLLGLAAAVATLPMGGAARALGIAVLRRDPDLDISPWNRGAPLGRAYLAQVPGEAHRNRLESALFERIGPEHGPRSLRDALHRAIAEDFTSGDTVRLSGWVLARTECRLCALAALA
jgi:hypothetical protein